MRILAFDIGGTEIKYGLCDDNFNLIQKNSVPTNAHEGGKRIVERIVEIAKTFEGFDRIGISTAGQVDSIKGEIIFATDSIPGYTGTKIKEIVESATGVPVAVENDVNSAAVGEAIFGAAKNCKNFICLTYGTGIGVLFILTVSFLPVHLFLQVNSVILSLMLTEKSVHAAVKDAMKLMLLQVHL